MKKLKVLFFVLAMFAFTILGGSKVQAYTTIQPTTLFGTGTLDSIWLNYKNLPTVTVSGISCNVYDTTTSGNNVTTGWVYRRAQLYPGGNGSISGTVTAYFTDCGTLNGRAIDMKLEYSDIVVNKSDDCYLYWTAFGTSKTSDNEWWYNGIEHATVKIYFYYNNNKQQITNLTNAYLSLFSEDENEGAKSNTASETYLYQNTSMAFRNQISNNRTYYNVFVGTSMYGTDASMKNCISFTYSNVNNLEVELFGVDGKSNIGYHFEYSPLTATLPDNPTKTVNKSESELGDTLTYTVSQKISKRYDSSFHYSSLVFSDTIDSNLTYNSLKVYNENGSDITASAGSVGYNSSTRRLTYTFNSTYLNNMAYDGQTYKFVISTKVNNSSTSATITDKATTTINNTSNLNSNTVSTVLKAKVVVHYVNKLGVKLADDTVINGNLLDSYTTSPKDIYAYELVSDSGNTAGTMQVNTTEVTYVYDLIRVDIDLTKTLEKTDSTNLQNLEGARFKLTVNEFASQVEYAKPAETYLSTYTDKNGHCIITGVPYGNYNIVEEVIPDVAYSGIFYLDGATDRINNFNIEINKDENLSYSLEDVAKKMQITVYKEDIETGKTTQGDAHLEGAEYTLYRDSNCTDAIETITIAKNEDGTYSATSGWYLVGTYYVKETKAPVGYLIDENVYKVSQDPAKQTGEFSSHSITSKDEVIRNSIELTKNLEETDSTQKQSLAGAVFSATLNSDTSKVYYSTVTDDNGYCIIEEIPYGTYTLKESTIPDTAYNGEFYIGDSDTRSTSFEQFIEIDSSIKEPYAYSDITDVAKKMQITIYKEDLETGTTTQGDARLEDAEYTLYRDEDCTDAIETIVIAKNDDGTYSATSGWYLVGKYWMKETKAPEGYLIDEEVYSVEVVPSEQTEEHSYHQITSKDEVMKGIVRVIKYNNNSSSTDEVAAEGAVLRLSLNSKPEKYYEATIDKYGYLEFVDNDYLNQYPFTIPYGKYTISEVGASNSGENIFINKQQTEIKYDEQTQKYILSDEYVRMRLKIEIRDSETDKKIPGGATFKIWNVNTQSWYEEMIYPSGEYISEFTTNDNGELTINRHLEAGSYVIYEVKSPEGYYLNDEVREGAKGYEFTVGVAQNGEVKVYHDNDEETLNYETITYDNTPTKMYSYTAVLHNDPQKAVINIEKLAEQFSKVSVEDTEYGTLNTPIYELKGLEGVSFRLVALEDVVTPEGTVRYTKGQVVSNVITTKDGLASTTKVYLGKYKLEEISTPNGYLNSNDPIELNIEYTNQYEKVQYLDEKLENERQQVKLSFEKEFEELKVSKFKIEDKAAVFGVYTKNTLKNYNNENVIGQDELVDIMIMDENNMVENNVQLPEGNYYVKELYVSNPYALSNDQYDFNVEYTNNTDKNIEYTINNGKVENEAKTVEFELIVYPDVIWDDLKIQDVTDRDTLEDLAELYGIAGKTYGVYSDKECTKPVITIDDEEATFETDENGIINIPDMPTGTYYFKEIIAPYGYELSDEVIKAQITTEDDFVLLKTKEPLKKANLLQKFDTFTKDTIEGVKFEITDEDGAPVYTGVTGKDGLLEIPIIFFENGKNYYYQEVSGPNMYKLDEEKYEFTAEYDEEECEWTLKLIQVGNDRKTIDNVIIRKTDSKTGEPLQGCEFTIVLLDENGEEYVNKNGEKIYLVENAITNEDGEYVIENVPYGTYRFVEIKAPEGYEMDEDITGLEFTVDENSPETIIFEVTNTGDIAVVTLAIVAVACVIGIVFIIVKNKKIISNK